jgi:anti-anti-sigma factor
MLRVRFEEWRGALVATPLTGRLDAEAAPELRDIVSASAAGRRLLVVSLAHVRAVDPSGLAALVAIWRAMGPGGELRIAHAAPRVRALLEETRLDELFAPIEVPAGVP